ncbi:hypothetical protein Tco_1394887 [Tanacetum coccineum]
MKEAFHDMLHELGEVMAFSVISISSDSSEESVGTSTARVILFGTILASIPSTTPTNDLPVIHDDTLLTPTISPRQSILVGQPYRTEPNGLLKMLTARKSVGSLPTLQLALRHPLDSSLSDYSLRHSSSVYAILDSPDDSSTAAFARPPCKRCRSPTSSVPAVSPIHGRTGYESYVLRETRLGVDIEDSYEPYTKPDIDFDIQADIDECIAYADAIRARGIDDMDVIETKVAEVVRFKERDTVKVEVDLRVGSVIKDDAHESVKEYVLDHVTSDGAVEVTYETLGGLLHRFHDHTVEIPIHRIQVIESVQRFSGPRIAGVNLEVTTITERIDALERDNTRLRGMLDVGS